MNIPPRRMVVIVANALPNLAGATGETLQRRLAVFARAVESEHELHRRHKAAKRERR